MPKDTFPSSHQLQKSWRESFSQEWKRPGGCLAWLWSGWINYIIIQHFSRCPSSAPLQTVSWYWLFSISSFVKSLYTFLYTFVYKLKIVTGLPWECFQISILYVVVASSLPFLLFLYHYELLFAAKQCSAFKATLQPHVKTAWSSQQKTFSQHIIFLKQYEYMPSLINTALN